MWAESIAKKYPQVSNIDAFSAKKLVEEQASKTDSPIVFVDHRDLKEQEVSMIKGAIASRDLAIESLPENAQVIIYCTIGERSSWYASKLMEKNLGQRKIFNLSGGILAWTFAEGELVDMQKNPTKKLHVYSPAYNAVADGYEGISK